jgi:hypothetical protein
MQRNPKKVSAGGGIVSLFVFVNAIVLHESYLLDANWPDLAYVTLPLLLISVVAFRLRLI